METVLSMLVSVRQGDWMVSIDLRDAPGRLVVQAPSLEACLRARDMVRLILGLWNSELREVAPRSIPEDYDLGEDLDSVRLRASPTLKRRVKVPSFVEEFPLRAAADHLLTGPAGPPSSLVQLVLGPRLRMRALQIELCRGGGVSGPRRTWFGGLLRVRKISLVGSGGSSPGWDQSLFDSTSPHVLVRLFGSGRGRVARFRGRFQASVQRRREAGPSTGGT